MKHIRIVNKLRYQNTVSNHQKQTSKKIFMSYKVKRYLEDKLKQKNYIFNFFSL